MENRRLNLQHATSSVTPPPAEEEKEIQIGEIVAQVLARKWLLITLVILGAIIGAFLGQRGFDEFRSSSVVQIESRSSGVTLPEELIGNLLAGDRVGQSPFATESHIIHSRLVLGPVVEELSADVRAVGSLAPFVGTVLARRSMPLVGDLFPRKFRRPGESITIGNLTVAEGFIGVPLLLTVTGPNEFVVQAPDGAKTTGKVGEPVEVGQNFRLTVSEIKAAAGREYRVFQEPIRNSVGRLRNGLRIHERGGTGIVDFSFTSEDPDFSRDVVNAVVDSYRVQNLQRRSAEIDQSIAFIDSKLPEVRTQLEEATKQVATYRESEQNLELSLGTQELLDQLVALQTQLEELEFEEQQLAQRLTPSHPEYQRLIAERERFEERIENIREGLQNVPAAEQELARLQERLIGSQELERQLIARVEQLRVLKASAVGNIRILEPAEVAYLIGPDRKRPIYLWAAIGLALAVALIVLLNFMRRGVEDAREVEALGLSVFGSVGKVRALSGAKTGAPEYAMALHDPESVAVEALRGLRTGLRFTLAANKAKSIMITSCAPADGKSFISLNLALVNAQLGERVLLIDADLRRGKLMRQFGMPRKSKGLTQVLVDECSVEDAIFEEPQTGLHFIGVGGRVPNPAELLESDKFSELLRNASEHYDLVIVDAPPALAVTDPGIIGQKADITLLIVRHLVTTKAEILSALKALSTAGVAPSGAVVNQFDVSKSRYGQYGTQYGYHYGAYNYRYKTDYK